MYRSSLFYLWLVGPKTVQGYEVRICLGVGDYSSGCDTIILTVVTMGRNALVWICVMHFLKYFYITLFLWVKQNDNIQ